VFTFLPGSVASRDEQRTAPLLTDEEYNQITSGVSSYDGPIKVFAWNVPAFCKLESRAIQKHLFDFLTTNSMLMLNLLGELLQPKLPL
jgi:hypothetical protein